MIPPIDSVISVEIIRDGGSLAACFLSPQGYEYWLFFSYIKDENSQAYLKIIGYCNPMIFDRFLGLGHEITWAHAIIYINQIRPLIRHERHLKMLEFMHDVAMHRGINTIESPRVYG